MNTLSEMDIGLVDVTKKKAKNLEFILWSAGIALFWVIFLWGFFEEDKAFYALGFNTSVFLFLVLIFLSRVFKGRLFSMQNLKWLIPIILIILSFSLYENPFIKTINIFVYPLLFIVFYNYGELKNKPLWSLKFLTALLNRGFNFFNEIGTAMRCYKDAILASKTKNGAIVKRVLLGVLLFLIISFIIIIPLLSSADNIFAAQMKSIYVWLKDLISMTGVARVFVFLFLAVFFLALALAWKKDFNYESRIIEKKADSIVSGIIIGGILLIYLFFLSIQFLYLWASALPSNFVDAVTMVKSGFWQLFALTVINIGIFFTCFQKTNPLVQKILMIFIAASFFLLASAGHRMLLYVTFYGYSYEKFYASYTVLYCGILLIWLFISFFIKQKNNVLKFVIFLFLWMYSLAAVFPVEQFVIRSNVDLSKSPTSRIHMYELKMLSSDVLKYVKDNPEFFTAKNDASFGNDWEVWIKGQEKLLSKKKWYEMNLSNLINNN